MKTLCRFLIVCIAALISIQFVAAQDVAVSFTSPNRAAAPVDYTRASRLGINHISDVTIPENPQRYRRALELGAGWNRWALYWDRVETDPGVFDWAGYDALVTADLAHGLNINAILLGIPNAHRTADGHGIAGLTEPIFADGTDIPARNKPLNPNNPFAVFVYRTVTRYMPGGSLAVERGWAADRGVRVWEVWNEPDFTSFWRGGDGAYARMLKVAYLVAHMVDPDATMMVGGLLYPTQRNWLAETLRVIERDPMRHDHGWFFDAVAVHSYADAWRSGWLTLYVRQTMIEFNIMRPIWLNESGAPIWNDYPGATWLAERPNQRRDYVTEAESAAYFLQSAAYAYAEGAEVVFLFQLYDDCGNQPAGTNFAPGDTSGHGDAFGIFRNPADAVCFSQHPEPDSPRPVANAYRLAAEVFGEVPFSPRGVVDTRQYPGVVSVTFSRPTTSERIVLVWNITARPLTVHFPALGEHARLITLETQTLIAPSDDKRYAIELAPASADRLPPTDPSVIPNGGMPIILIERLPYAESVNLQVATGVLAPQAAIPPTPTAIPVIAVSHRELQARLRSSPTGAIFTALQYARLRTAPDTQYGEVVGQLAPNTSASIMGRLADSSWYQVEYEGRTVWVAGFLGAISGDSSRIIIVSPP